MTKYYQQNKKCYACGRHRTSRYLGYDLRTMKSYCIDPRMCPASSKIPDDVELVPMLDREVMLTTLEEHYEGAVLEALDKLLGKTHSFRPTPAQSMHLLKVAQTFGLPSLNATILHILEEHMQEHSMDHVELTEVSWNLDGKWTFPRRRPQPRRTPAVATTPEPEPEPQQVKEETEEEIEDNDMWTV